MIDVTNCARCTQSHRSITFVPLSTAVALGSDEPSATYWAPCPTNLQPVLLQVVDSNDPTKDVTR